MKVKILDSYIDKTLGREVQQGEVIDITDLRIKELYSIGVVVEVVKDLHTHKSGVDESVGKYSKR